MSENQNVRKPKETSQRTFQIGKKDSIRNTSGIHVKYLNQTTIVDGHELNVYLGSILGP
jgi:hypothetical protein